MSHDRETYRESAYIKAERLNRYETAAGIIAACMTSFFVGYLVGGGW